MSDDSPDLVGARCTAVSGSPRELGASRTDRVSSNEALPSARGNPTRNID
jgi:hypothetical protein